MSWLGVSDYDVLQTFAVSADLGISIGIKTMTVDLAAGSVSGADLESDGNWKLASLVINEVDHGQVIDKDPVAPTIFVDKVG